MKTPFWDSAFIAALQGLLAHGNFYADSPKSREALTRRAAEIATAAEEMRDSLASGKDPYR